MSPPPLPPLPEGFDAQQLRRLVLDAAQRVSARAQAAPESTAWMRRWRRTEAAVEDEAPPAMLATLVGLAFPEDETAVDLAAGLELMAALGAERARLRIAQDHAIRLAVHMSRETLQLMDEELATALALPEFLAVHNRLAAVTDLYMSEYLVGFLEESSALAAEQETLSTDLLDSTRAGFALGAPDGTVSVTNTAFQRFFGAGADPVGRTWADVLGIEDLPEVLQHDTYMRRDLVLTDELGAEHVVQLSLHRIRDRLQAVAVDVSLEADYARIHREFVAGLIHDLRSPLAVISGWSHTLMAESERIDTPIRDEALITINRAARQLTRMSDNLLELTLLEGGSHRLDLELLDAAARTRFLVDAGYTATVEGVDEAGVLADPDAFERMLTNLLDNAVAHGSPPVRVHVRMSGTSVVVDVMDQGEIDPAVLDAAESGRVGSARGFGLGLRTTLLLARAHGGDLKLSGLAPTTFTLTLPLATVG